MVIKGIKEWGGGVVRVVYDEQWRQSQGAQTEVLHATDSHFRKVVNFKMCRLLDKLQAYGGKMAARKGKHTKRMKTPMKVYELDDKDSIKILRFPAQL